MGPRKAIRFFSWKTAELGLFCTNMIDLRAFQKRFLAGALAPGIDTAALSIPRGNGKSTLAAYVLARALTPGDKLNVLGAEYLLCAGSIEQARNTYRPIRAELEPTGAYKFLDSQMRLGVTHKASNTRLRVMSSNAKTAFGVVGVPLVVADEPGAWEQLQGGLMNDALQTAQGKPGSSLRVIYIGTLAPAMAGWWIDLIKAGSVGSTYVQKLAGDRETWDSWQTIRRCNPLVAVSPAFRRKLLEERNAARRDSRLKARFLSYRLNVPSGDESEMLLTVDDWDIATKRPVGIPAGRPIVGIDLGGGRSWSAACAVWESGRLESLAVAPGIPDIATQERRDGVPAGTYLALADRGALSIADGLHVQPPGVLWQSILDRWGVPVLVVCDRFRLGELEDAIRSACPVEPRVTQWSSAAADIRALRKFTRDGPLSFAESSRELMATSLMAATVQNDNAGNFRLIKRGKDNKARDDVAAAMTLAAGAYDRAAVAPQELRYAIV